jgi:hypothetical protein
MRLFLEQKFRLSNKLFDTTLLSQGCNKIEQEDIKDDKVRRVNVIVATQAKPLGSTLQNAGRPVAEVAVDTRKYLYLDSLPTIIHEYCY